MTKSANVTRDILLSLGAAVLFGGGLTAYLLNTIPSREELASHSSLRPSSMDKRPDTLAVAGALMNRFAAQLAAKRYADAYALMAPPYRNAVALEAFTQTCERSAFLAGARRAEVLSTRQMSAAGAPADAPFTLQARGLLIGTAGSIDMGATLLVERGVPAILVLMLAGVPVLDGVSPR